MNAWLATFAPNPDSSYIRTTAESEEAGLPLALVMDHNHARLRDRVTYVTRLWAGTFADYQTRHFTQRTACRLVEEAVYELQSNLLVAYTPVEEGRTDLFATGVCLDRVAVDGPEASFLAKKVVLDSAMVERALATTGRIDVHNRAFSLRLWWRCRLTLGMRHPVVANSRRTRVGQLS